MFDGFVTARVKLEPCIRLENLAIVYDDMSTLRDHALDLSSREDPLFTVRDRGGQLRRCHGAVGGGQTGCDPDSQGYGIKSRRETP